MTQSRIITLAVIYYFASSRMVRGEDYFSLEDSASDAAIVKPCESGTDVDDRIGLTINSGRAQAAGPGGLALSHSSTFGLQAGIFNPQTNSYKPLHNKFGGFSTQFRTGPQAPNAWSASSSSGKPGSIGGQASAGFRGGHGSTKVKSHTINRVIPLADGTVLLSDLKEPSISAAEDQIDAEQENADKVCIDHGLKNQEQQPTTDTRQFVLT